MRRPQARDPINIEGLEFDRAMLEYIHRAPIRSFARYGRLIELPDRRFLCHQDNGGQILLIAHLDSTMPANWFGWTRGRGRERAGHHLIHCPTVDDRLGAYVILDLLPRLLAERNLPPVDILLTEGEEIGQSTAAYFNSEIAGKQYHWMAQFDRMASDVVHYQYRKPEWLTALRATFGRVEHGMFSDICYLEHLGCAGANFGTGYHEYTSYKAWADLNELARMVYGFLAFYNEHHQTHFAHDVLEQFRSGGAGVIDDAFFLCSGERCAGDPIVKPDPSILVELDESDYSLNERDYYNHFGVLSEAGFANFAERLFTAQLTDQENALILALISNLRKLFQDDARAAAKGA